MILSTDKWGGAIRYPKLLAAYSALVLFAALCAIDFSPHPVAWLIGLIVSIPVFAAIARATTKSRK
jgi:hypothetical protein